MYLQNSLTPVVLLLLFVLGGQRLSGQSVQADKEISEFAQAMVDDKAAPGVVAAVARKDEPVRIGFAGVRHADKATKMTAEDKLHLGSCTKAITATLIARMVEKDQLRWSTTIAQGLPKLKRQIHSQYHGVTLEQLLRHKGGIPEQTDWSLRSGRTVTEMREAIVVKTLKKRPVVKPGEKYVYSNLSYMIAGLIAAKQRETTWEELVTEEVFKPLGITTAGFGPPATKGKVDQPWGHRSDGQKFIAVQRDNPATLGPAGTVHMTISDWAKFALAHTADKDTEFLQAESLRKLHTADPESNYSLGWIVLTRPWGKGTVLTHSGSNTLWYATVWVAPKTQTAYLAVANARGKETAKQLDQLIYKMIQTK